MIIKFDHISRVAAQEEYKQISEYLESLGYELLFKEIDKPNSPNKSKYLFYNNRIHNLYYYNHNEKLPVEIITYPKITKSYSPFIFKPETNQLSINSSNLSVFEILTKRKIDIQEGQEQIDIKGVLDKNTIFLGKNINQNSVWNLDNEGYCCPTFIVSKATSYHTYLIERKLICSEINEIEINKNKIFVFFVEGENGEVIEIISYK